MTTFDITDAFLERLVQRGIVCMAWTQVYDPAGSVVLSALSAAIPLMVLFYMLAIRRAKGHVAAIVGLAVAFVLAVALWGMPFGTAVSSVAYGMANGLFPIVWIVITAVWVYNMTVESGEFEIIKDSLARLTDDRRLQALFIAFAFGAFLEGTAGFGTPVAITAAMLAGIGFNPLYAAGLCLIANTAPVAFGAIGVPVIVAGQVSGFDPNLISAIVGRQLPFLSVIVPLWLCVTMCGFKRSMEVLPAILVAGLCFAISQFVFSNYHGPTLPDIMSDIITLVGLVILLRFWKPATIWRFEGEKPTVLTGKGYSFGEVIRAWIPFIILAVMVFFWGLPQFKAFLDGISGSIATKKVVLASGVWTPGLGDMVGVKVPIRPRQGQILVTERLDGLVSKNYAEFGYLAAKSGKKRPGVTPEMEQFGVAMVLEPSAAGTVLIGSSRRFVGMDTTPHPAVMQAIAQRAKHFFPSFSGVKLIRAYAGVRPASPDGKPIISPTHVEGVYVAAGHEGNGIGLSLITGKLVSQMLRGETPLVDLAPLCIDRFGMNPPSLPSA